MNEKNLAIAFHRKMLFLPICLKYWKALKLIIFFPFRSNPKFHHLEHSVIDHEFKMVSETRMNLQKSVKQKHFMIKPKDYLIKTLLRSFFLKKNNTY